MAKIFEHIEDVVRERDDLLLKLDEAQRKLKNYEPVALYNGKSIEQYAAELKAADDLAHEQEDRLHELESRLEAFQYPPEHRVSVAERKLADAECRLGRCRCGAADAREHQPGCVLPWFHSGDCSDVEPPNVPDAWDRQIEADAAAGKLDGLRDEALAALRDGTAEDLVVENTNS